MTAIAMVKTRKKRRIQNAIPIAVAMYQQSGIGKEKPTDQYAGPGAKTIVRIADRVEKMAVPLSLQMSDFGLAPHGAKPESDYGA